jgi:ribosome-binding ATPase
MSLSVGIVGLPNVGKSTLFNALLKKQQAYVANFPFATIDPNIGVVPVPDERLTQLADVVSDSSTALGMTQTGKRPPEVPATIEFLDIAGLITGAHKGEGLGNKFLANIREVDAILHVVRVFTDTDIIKEGSVDPKSDFETIETELAMADLTTLEKQQAPRLNATKEDHHRWEAVQKIRPVLEKGRAAREVELTAEEKKAVKSLSLLTIKPILIALNINEGDLKNATEIEKDYAEKFAVQEDQVIAISAKLEMQLADLDETERLLYLNDLGIGQTSLERLIAKAFSTLGLITFLTAGEVEVRAWTIKEGITALEASGVIHTDFMQKFIKADICKFNDFITYGGWKVCREEGKVRSEGRDYIMKDGEVVEFKIGT